MIKLISHKRLDAAARRLARFKFKCVADMVGPMTLFEAAEINRRACIPWAWVKLASRLWKRGHIIIDEETCEVVRKPRFDPHSFTGR